MINEKDRRPLASRDTGWAHTITRWLAKTAITPNQISIASMFAAGICGVAFCFAAQTDGNLRIFLLICGAIFCQIRLLCNLFDGMVAVEAGKSAPDGAFWNEFPDRISDIVIFAGIGYGIDAPALGWAAGALSVLTAYIRELGRASGAGTDFCGPMAKPQRMATITIAAVLTMFAPLWNGHNQILLLALWIIAIGALATVVRRSARLITALQKASSRNTETPTD